MRLALVLILSLASLSGCGFSDCCSAFERFEGITETDANGQIVGTEDASDWRVGSGSAGGLSTVTVRPAAPNPATDETFIEIVLDAPDVLTVTVQREDSDNPLITVIDGQSLAVGVHRLRIVRPPSAPGLFNIYVLGSTFATVGDVRFE